MELEPGDWTGWLGKTNISDPRVFSPLYSIREELFWPTYLISMCHFLWIYLTEISDQEPRSFLSRRAWGGRRHLWDEKVCRSQHPPKVSYMNQSNRNDIKSKKSHIWYPSQKQFSRWGKTKYGTIWICWCKYKAFAPRSWASAYDALGWLSLD